MADAPSCSTATRSITLSGMVFRSTAPGTPDADAPAIQRLPSTSTSVRFALTLRMASCAAPAPIPEPSCGKPELPGTLNCELIADPEIGNCCRASARFVRPVLSMSDAPISMMATGSSRGFLRIRDPVTITSSSSSASCASAISAGATARLKTRAEAAPTNTFDLIITPPPLRCRELRSHN